MPVDLIGYLFLEHGAGFDEPFLFCFLPKCGTLTFKMLDADLGENMNL